MLREEQSRLAAIEVVGAEPLAVHKLDAIATFMALGDDTKLSVFDMTKAPQSVPLLFLKSLLMVWLAIAFAIIGVGWLAVSRGRLVLGGYVAFLLVVLFTV